MAITRWTPLQELDSIERRARRLLERAGFAPPLLPAADVYETDGEVVVELEIPGFAEDDLQVEITGHALVVRGRRTEEVDEQRRDYRLQERMERTFERRFFLPHDIEADGLTAEFGKGVLTVRAPKHEPEKPARQVPIETLD